MENKTEPGEKIQRTKTFLVNEARWLRDLNRQ